MVSSRIILFNKIISIFLSTVILVITLLPIYAMAQTPTPVVELTGIRNATNTETSIRVSFKVFGFGANAGTGLTVAGSPVGAGQNCPTITPHYTSGSNFDINATTGNAEGEFSFTSLGDDTFYICRLRFTVAGTTPVNTFATDGNSNTNPSRVDREVAFYVGERGSAVSSIGTHTTQRLFNGLTSFISNYAELIITVMVFVGLIAFVSMRTGIRIR